MACTQIAFLQIDCHKLGRQTKYWPIAVFFLGPFALWPFFLVAHKGRGFLYILGSVPVYVMTGLPAAVLFFVTHPEALGE